MRMNESLVNNLIVNAVQTATRDIREAFVENGLRMIRLSLHEDIDLISATFNNDNNESAWCNITEIMYTPSEGDFYFTIIGEDVDGNMWSGYLDKYYGDYFDVAQSIGHIYEAVAMIVNKGEFFDIEKED